MNTGLFELMKAVRRPELIIRYLDGASFDDLVEINLSAHTFRSIYHESNKYTIPLPYNSDGKSVAGLFEKLLHPDDFERFAALMDEKTIDDTLEDSELPGVYCGEFRFFLINGSWRWVELVLVKGAAYGIGKDILRMYVFDCHNRKVRELGLKNVVVYSGMERNEMTGLLKKSSFIRDVEHRLQAPSKTDWSLVSIDIENFKLFNEWYGHEEGDLLMVQIGATLLEASERTGGTAGYFGQDDFCLMVPFDMELIGALYDDIASLVSQRGGNVGFLPAFGVSRVEKNCSTLDLLDRAFLAAQVAKSGYRNRVRVFEKSMYMRTDEEYHVLNEFFQALRQHYVVFYLQPQCRASSGKIVGAEALARWIKPDGTVIPPNVFIPVLEKRGLISDLDMYIWEEVCRWQRAWINSGHTPLPVSVNVSVADILHIDLPAFFENLTEKYSLERRLIKIEITETSYISNTALVKETVHSLREKGFTVLMDDFGSGYSTLNMLKNMNIDIIKLDAQFLNMDESNEEKSIRILESVTNMTKTIGVPIIVEGVETEQQRDFLMDLGCRYIQGYYFYRPMPTADYEKLISNPQLVDNSGITFKSNQQFRLRELLDNNVYSDTMLNNILGPCAFYSLHGDDVDIVRYNEQFYEAVDIPNFSDRLEKIQRFMPKSDVPLMLEVLREAALDRLNGTKGIFHFYKTNGTLTTFYMHFYYLHAEGDCQIFYGAVQNITKLSNLEKQVALLSRISAETVLFLSRLPDNEIRFTVLFNGLESEIGMDAPTLEQELNSGKFHERIGSENNRLVYREALRKINNYEPFTAAIQMQTDDGGSLALSVHGYYMQDDTENMNYIINLKRKID